MECLPNKSLSNDLPKFLFSLVILVLALATFPPIAASAAREGGQEAHALLKWKASLHYPTLSPLFSWKLIPPLKSTHFPPPSRHLNESSACTWAGISCDSSGSIIHINLAKCGLNGTLRNLSFSSFPKLLTLDLSLNSLHGTIPQQLGMLKLLQVLDLSENRLTGSIPTSVENMDNLVNLYLVGNRLSGSIPRE